MSTDLGPELTKAQWRQLTRKADLYCRSFKITPTDNGNGTKMYPWWVLILAGNAMGLWPSTPEADRLAKAVVN
jgi:hypothetical protein